MHRERPRLGIVPVTVIAASVITVAMVPLTALLIIVMMDWVEAFMNRVTDVLNAFSVGQMAAEGVAVAIVLVAAQCVVSLMFLWAAIHWLGPRDDRLRVGPGRCIVAIAIISAALTVGASVALALSVDTAQSLAQWIADLVSVLGVRGRLDDVLPWAILVTGPALAIATTIFGYLHLRWARRIELPVDDDFEDDA